MTTPLNKVELREIKQYLERLFVGRTDADRFLALLDRVTENIDHPKPSK